VRLNPLTHKASDADIEKIKEWLKFASERDGAHKERAQKKRDSVVATTTE